VAPAEIEKKKLSMIDLYVKIGLGLITFIGSVWGLYKTAEGVRDLYLQTFPQIEVVGSDPSSPTALPVSIANPSGWFTMSEVHWSTMILELKSPVANWTNVGADTGGLTDIPPNSHRVFEWPMKFVGVPINYMKVRVSVTYKVLHLSRTTTEAFSWYANRWVKGELAR